MARLPRFNLPNVPQHIIQRGNNRQVIFFDEVDYTVYLSKLEEYATKYKVAIHSFILMTNHVHILATPKDEMGVSKMMQSLGAYFVRYINNKYQRTGTLWEGRFRSTIIETEEYFYTLSRYIELNAVRADMVEHPSEYPWSSYHFNALGKDIKLITPHFCYLSLGATPKLRQQNYLTLFEHHIPEYTLQEIRNATNKAWVLGNLTFKKQIEKQIGRSVEPALKGGDRKSKKFKNQRL